MTSLAQSSRQSILFAALLLLLTCLPTLAQVQAGRIVGTIFDPNKATVPSAAVTVTDTATNQTVSVAMRGVPNDFLSLPAVMP